MTAIVSYIVVPFVLARKGKIGPGTPQTFKDKEKALRAGAARAMTAIGVMVLEERADLAGEIFDEPRLIAHFGEIPEELFQFCLTAGSNA